MSFTFKYLNMKPKLCFLFFLIVQTILAQTKFQEIETAINKQEVTKIVTKIACLIDSNYVFENKGRSISDSLLRKVRQNELVNIKDWRILADSLTIIIQKLSNDGHMYVRNEPETVKKIIDAENKKDNQIKSKPTEDPFFYGPDALANNFGFSEVKILKGNYGYIKLSEINISKKSLPTLYSAMQFISHTQALIIDLSNNGGGGSDIGAVLESFFLPGNIPLLEFVSRNGEKHIERTITWLTEKKYDNPIFIIINNRTASAAEAFVFSMKKQNRASIIGKRSSGAAHMNSWYAVNHSLFISISTGAPTIPGTETSWEKVGIAPDFEVDAGKEIEFILSKLKK